MKFIGHLFISILLIWTAVECQENVSNSTTEETNTTSPATTTAITTTELPTTESPIANWTVTNATGTVCMMVQMSASLVLEYPVSNGTTEGTEVATIHLFDSSATVSPKSNCDGTMILMFGHNNTLTLKFSETDSKVSLNNITLYVMYDNKTFPDHATKDHTYIAENQKYFETSKGKSYMCKVSATLALSNNSKIAVDNVQVQAFSESLDGKFAAAEECDADEGDVSDIVPIAVGCALAGLVVIVLIAYLVGRRQKRQKGYESV